ncbi:DUF481 domain-containing protein [Luteimonas aquatica]|uniref:DUF481 domain-containing protein n=1 Tax=Luteimonas aquatica TaxID=450364 RepID=UPI001F569C60|nr:DUF481 domain-containing protein [Luteimonas aquatica]
MSTAWWLALAGLPVFQHPLPESPGEPALVAIAAGRASLRMPCYELVCPDAEWMAPTRYTALRAPKAPGALPRLRPMRTPLLATRSITSLSAPTSRRDWINSEISNTKIGTSYGFEALRRPGTDLRVQLGTGYRIVPYADYGTAMPGPIARGGFVLSQDLSDRARLDQQVMVETGRRNTYVRQTIGVDVTVAPQWTLRSDLEMRHDSAANNGKGATDTEGSVKLRYSF